MITRSIFIFILLLPWITLVSQDGKVTAEKALSERDYELSIRICNDLIAIDSLQADLYRIRGIAFQGLQDYQGALESFNHAFEIDSSNPTLGFYKSECLEQLGDIRSAISILQDIYRNDTTLLYCNRNLARLLVKERRFNEALPYCIKLVEKFPGTYIYRKNLATCYYYTDEIAKALVNFREAWKLNRRDMSLPVSIANCYVKFKEPQMAIDILKDGLTSDSANINILKTIGYLYYLAEDYAMASDNFSKAHEAGDSTSFVYKHLGISLYYQNRYESAIPCLEEYYHADTLNSEATYYLGLAMSNWHMKTEGISYLEKTLNLLTPEPIYIGSIWATIGLTYSDMNMNLQAIRSYRRALESDPGRSAYMLEIAKMHDIIGKRDSDASEYRKAIEWFEKYLSIEEPRLKTIMETRNLDMQQIETPGTNYAKRRIKAINEELFFMGEK